MDAVTRRGSRVLVISGRFAGRTGVVVAGNGANDYVAICEGHQVPVRTVTGQWALVDAASVKPADVRVLSNAQLADLDTL